MNNSASGFHFTLRFCVAASVVSTLELGVGVPLRDPRSALSTEGRPKPGLRRSVQGLSPHECIVTFRNPGVADLGFLANGPQLATRHTLFLIVDATPPDSLQAPRVAGA